jgi:hypothetical protein
MAKRGRPRRDLAEQAGITGSMLQRARAISLLPILETPFGQMAFCREFTDYQIETVDRIRQIYRDYAQAHGLKRWPASPGFEVGRGMSPTFEDVADREQAESAKKAFERLHDMISRFPLGLQFALDELIVQERHCPPGYLSAVKNALDMLAIGLGYKARKKRLDISKVVND